MLNSLAKGQYAHTDVYRAHATLTADEQTSVLLITDRYGVTYNSIRRQCEYTINTHTHSGYVTGIHVCCVW